MKSQSVSSPHRARRTRPLAPSLQSGASLVVQGAGALVMLSAALSLLYPDHPTIALLLGSLLIPLGLAALLVTIRANLRCKPSKGRHTGDQIKDER
jgi:hypothetical protein